VWQERRKSNLGSANVNETKKAELLEDTGLPFPDSAGFSESKASDDVGS